MKQITATNAPPSSDGLKLSTTASCERKEKSCSLSRSLSSPSLTHETAARSRNVKGSGSLADLNFNSSFEELTPACTDECDGETSRFQVSCPGLDQCRETALVFHMKEGGQLLYRILPWNRSQLSQHHKKPAGPLFDIRCVKEASMCQLHLPHCDIRSTGGCRFWSLARVSDDVIDFIRPHKITGTHVVIKVTGFSGLGNVKDEDSPSVPIRALVLPFYKPPQDLHLKHIISVLLLPHNVVVKDVLHFRRKLDGNDTYIETPPHCKLNPQQVYSLTSNPGGDSVKVQPPHAAFDEESYNNYLATFQLIYETRIDEIEVFLKDSSSSRVWERRLCPCCRRSSRPDLPSDDGLLEIRSSLVERMSGPVLQSLLDKLLEKRVIGDPERESVEEKTTRGDGARCLIDAVRRKGQDASSEMMEVLKELDPFLCEHLDLI